MSDVSKAKIFYATNSCASLLKYTSTKQHCVNHRDNEQLQLLLKVFCNVFLDDLPSKLPLERTITHGIDLMPDSKPINQSVYCLNASETSKVEKQLIDYLQ